MPISSVFGKDNWNRRVVILFGFKRRFYRNTLVNSLKWFWCLQPITVPVSGAHNTIVTAHCRKRFGQFLAWSLTIGDRFGGALMELPEQFSAAFDQGLSPSDFVQSMRKEHRLILGIGHKIKSRTNPDLRVSILIEFARKHFPRL